MLVPALGQVDRSGIIGPATDQSGAFIAGAQAKVTNTATGQTTEVRSDEGGRYSASLLRVGVYTVAAEHPGFARTVQSNVVVEVGQFATADLTLSIGEPSTQIDVTAATPLVDTQSGSLGTVESEKRVVELFAQRAGLRSARLPQRRSANDGEAGGNLRQGTVENPRPEQRLSVNGLRNRQQQLAAGRSQITRSFPNGRPDQSAPPPDA